MTAEMVPRVDGLEILSRRHDPAKGWLLLTEVQFNGRRADALAIQLWGSRGYVIHGYEIKRTRHDVVRELSDPSKADACVKACDFWWLFVETRGIVQLEELPARWGLMEARGGRTHVVRHAQRAASPQRPLWLWVRLLQRTRDLTESRMRQLVRPHEEDVYENARERALEAVQAEQGRVREERASVLRLVDGLAAAGIDYQALRWRDPVKVAQVIRMLTGGGGQVRQAVVELQRVGGVLQEVIGALAAVEPVP